MKWDDRNVRDNYEENIRVGLHNVMNVNFNDITDKNIADNVINAKCEELNNIIHNAVEKAMFDRPSNYQGRHRKVPRWNTECTVARDRIRFWRNIWCGSNRVRHCPVFDIYKSTKTMYRNVRRQAMRGSMRSWFDKINYLFRSSSNSKQFWNRVRMCKDSSGQSSDKVSIHSFAAFYRERFSEKDILTVCVRYGVSSRPFFNVVSWYFY